MVMPPALPDTPLCAPVKAKSVHGAVTVRIDTRDSTAAAAFGHHIMSVTSECSRFFQANISPPNVSSVFISFNYGVRVHPQRAGSHSGAANA